MISFVKMTNSVFSSPYSVPCSASIALLTRDQPNASLPHSSTAPLPSESVPISPPAIPSSVALDTQLQSGSPRVLPRMPPPEEIDDDPFSDAADVLDRVQIPPIHSVVAFGSEEALESLHIPHGLPLDTILEQRSCSTLHTRQSGSAQSHLSHLRRSSSAPEGLGSASISQCSSRTTSQSLGKNVNQTRASIANQLQGSGPSEKEPESPTKPPLRSSQPTGREGQTLSHSPDLDRSHVNQDSGEARQSPGKRIRKLWHRIAIEKSNPPAARLWDELRTVRGAETACAPLYGVQKCTASVPHGTLIGPFQPETLGSTETRDGAASRHSGFLAQATDSTVDTNDRHTPQSKSHSTGQQSPPLFPHLVPAPLSISNKLCKRSKYSQDASNGSGDANTDCQQGSYDTTNGCTPSSCVDLQVDNGCGPRNSTSEATLYEDALASFGSDDGTAAHEDRAQGCSPSMSLDSLIAARSIHKRTLDKVPDTALGLDLSSPKSCSNSSSDDDPFLMFPTPPSPRHDQPDLKAFPLALQNVRSGTPQSPTRQSRNSRLARNTLQTHSTETQTKLDLRETRGQTGGQARVYGRCPHGRVLINSNTTNATEALLKSHTAKLPKYLVPRRALGCWRCQFLVSVLFHASRNESLTRIARTAKTV